MKALILAAGKGERMRPLTLHTPKPLLKVGGKPLIVWHIEKLAAIGIRNIVINTSWLAHKFPEMLGDGAQFGVQLHFSYEGEEPLETGGGMLNALPLLGTDPFLVVNGDIWTDANFAFLPSHPAELAHVLLVPMPAFRQPGVFESTVSPLLNEEPQSLFTLSGIGVYRPELLAEQSAGKFSITPLLIAAANCGKLSVERLTGEWQDIGTPERLIALDRQLGQ